MPHRTIIRAGRGGGYGGARGGGLSGARGGGFAGSQGSLSASRSGGWGYFLFAFFLAGVVGLLMAQEVQVGLGLTGAIIGGVLMIACMLDTMTGLAINMIFSFTCFHLSRWLFNDTLAVGTIDDIIVFSTLIGLFLRRVPMKATFQSFVHNRAVVWFIIYMAYGILEAANPYAHSIQGWVLGFRAMLGTYVLLYTAYVAFDTRANVRRFIWIFFWGCLVVGLYGCWQEWFGLSDMERNWVMSDDLRFGLIFIAGTFRKFSMLSDPTAFGLLMAAAALFFTIYSSVEKGRARWIMRLGLIPMYLGMAYSGTRTADGMIVAGLGFYILLTLHRRATRIMAVVATLVFLFLLFVPYYSNNTLNRFRSTFSATQDQSYIVREDNRHFIQPYIWNHPIGGGLCTTGVHGTQYNPGHPLAGFPPDNGYLEKALETGSIGLALICLLYFFVLRTGIRAYFRATEQEDKVLAAGCTVAIFSLYAATYSQVALGQLSDNILYYPFIAILLRIGHFKKPDASGAA